ncbi:leucine-rich repeat flightless-interacting protein 2-like [Lampetra planeri]
MDMANHAAGVGRRRASVKDRFSAEDEALSQIAREAEARLAAKRAARAEAREFRMRDLEKQQKELDEKSDREGMELVRPTSLCRASSGVSGLSAATLASLGNGGGPRGGPPGWEGVRGGPAGSSRRGSGDTSASLESEACVRELRVRRHGDTDTGGHGDKGTRGQGGSVARG